MMDWPVRHGAKARIGYMTPNDMLTGRQAAIHAERDRKLEQARQQRQLRRSQTHRTGWVRMAGKAPCDTAFRVSAYHIFTVISLDSRRF